MESTGDSARMERSCSMSASRSTSPTSPSPKSVSLSRHSTQHRGGDHRELSISEAERSHLRDNSDTETDPTNPSDVTSETSTSSSSTTAASSSSSSTVRTTASTTEPDETSETSSSSSSATETTVESEGSDTSFIYLADYDAMTGHRYFYYDFPVTVEVVTSLPYAHLPSNKDKTQPSAQKKSSNASRIVSPLHHCKSRCRSNAKTLSSDTEAPVHPVQDSTAAMTAAPDAEAAKSGGGLPMRSLQPLAGKQIPVAATPTLQPALATASAPLQIIGAAMVAVPRDRIEAPAPLRSTSLPLQQQQDESKEDTGSMTAALAVMPQSDLSATVSPSASAVGRAAATGATSHVLPATLALRPLRQRTRFVGLLWRLWKALSLAAASLQWDVMRWRHDEDTRESTEVPSFASAFSAWPAVPSSPPSLASTTASSSNDTKDLDRWGLYYVYRPTPSEEAVTLRLQTEDDWRVVRETALLPATAEAVTAPFLRLYLLLEPTSQRL